MVSLSEFAKNLEHMGKSSIEIIELYLILTNQEADALEMIPKLAKSATEKVQTKLDYARSWIPCLVDTSRVNKSVTKEQGDLILKLSFYFCLGMTLPDYVKEQAESIIPNMNTPKLIFIPMVDWLSSEYGITFRDAEKQDNITPTEDKPHDS